MGAVTRAFRVAWVGGLVLAGAVRGQAAEPPRSSAADPERARRIEGVLLLPTLTPGGDDPAGKALHAPRADEGELRARADELDATLREAIEDSGFELAIPDADELARGLRDAALVARATEGERARWVLSPRVERVAGRWHLRFVAVAPGERELRVRVEESSAVDLPARALVTLRQLLLRRPAGGSAPIEAREPQASHVTPGATRTSGRVVLALHGAAFGAFGGLAVERTSGSEDSRLLFPLLAIGGSVGAGAAILAADEWNIDTDGASSLGIAMLTGTVAGYALGAEYVHVGSASRAYAYGVAGGVAGLSVGAFTLAHTTTPSLAATLAAGAFLGAIGGTLTSRLAKGNLDAPLTQGLGEGVAAGILGTAALAVLGEPDANRLVNLNLGAGLGALVGAAAGTPFLLEPKSVATDRSFLACTLAGAAAGGALGYWLAPKTSGLARLTVVPSLGATTGVAVAGSF